MSPPPTPTPATPEATPTPGPPTPTSTPLPAGSVIGIFDNHTDIGSVLADGDAFYEEENGQYTVIGSGADVWDQSDGFHFLYKEVSDDFVLEAKIDGENFGTSNWVKFMLMARQSLEHDAAYYAARFQESNFQASSQWRTTQGASAGSTPSGDRISSPQHDNRLRIARKGDRFENLLFQRKQQPMDPPRQPHNPLNRSHLRRLRRHIPTTTETSPKATLHKSNLKG